MPQAFPGAEGWGAGSVGGTGGRNIIVTSLADAGPGTLREALEASGPRIVTFGVSGVIQLRERIRMTEPFLTLRGDTAPSPGVIISGVPQANSDTHPDTHPWANSDTHPDAHPDTNIPPSAQCVVDRAGHRGCRCGRSHSDGSPGRLGGQQ